MGSSPGSSISWIRGMARFYRAPPRHGTASTVACRRRLLADGAVVIHRHDERAGGDESGEAVEPALGGGGIDDAPRDRPFGPPLQERLRVRRKRRVLVDVRAETDALKADGAQQPGQA